MVESLLRQMDSGTIDAMSQRIGATPDQTQTAVLGALPLLMGALQRNASQTTGAEALARALGRDHDGGILNDITGSLASSGAGDKILGHVLGARRSNVETGLSRMSGLDAGAVAKLLPMLAPLVLGALGKTQRERRLDPGSLSSYLEQERADVERREPSAMGALGKLLDQDGDGDALDDVARLGTSLLSGFLKR